MGGRGAKIGVVSRAPKQTVKIRNSKLKSYLLNPSKAKGKDKLFKAVGYNMKNHDRLKRDLIEGLNTNEAKVYADDKIKTRKRYEVDMSLGVNKKMVFTTGWLRNGNGPLEFVTAYKKRK